MFNIKPIIPLVLQFRATSKISELPHYHGAHWHALLRFIFDRHIKNRFGLKDYDIWVHPTDYGIRYYRTGDVINLGITIPASYDEAIVYLFENFNVFGNLSGHFQPTETVVLEGVYRRIQIDSPIINWDVIKAEVDYLSSKDECTIYFNSPLKLPRPERDGETKEERRGHKYCDEDFFTQIYYENHTLAVEHFLKRIRMVEELNPEVNPSLRMIPVDLVWVDAGYKRNTDLKKGLGGIMGKVILKGNITPEIAEILIIGQYVGIGRNPNFGCGFYNIVETDPVKKVAGLSRGKTLFDKVFNRKRIKQVIGMIDRKAEGVDRVSIDDVKGMEEEFTDKLIESVVSGAYRQQRLRKVNIPKNYAGEEREIIIQSMKDKIVHKAAQVVLEPIIDRLLSPSSYAFRDNVSREQAVKEIHKSLNQKFVYGLKADIDDFFPSINIDRLKATLEAYFPYEPIVHHIINWYREMNTFDTKGLPQGSPLSPMLSNIYLDDFDRELGRKGFRVYRYCDDFVMLSKEKIDTKATIKMVNEKLSRYKLTINEDKTEEITPDKPIKFIGYSITAERLKKAERNTSIYDVEDWVKLFSGVYSPGITLYISYDGGYAHTQKGDIIITPKGKKKDKNEEPEQDTVIEQEEIEHVFPWNMIKRIVVIGRARISQGAIYKAINERVPITFISITGKTKAKLNPYVHMHTYLTRMQDEFLQNETHCLETAKDIISAKLHNMSVLMARNNMDTEGFKMLKEKISGVSTLDSLRGIEGAASKLYFGYFGKLVDPFTFEGRVYHPPEGEVNSMLSFGYTLLYNRVANALYSEGLDARAGIFHVRRGWHYALASDLMEPLRHIVERIVLNLIHHKIIKKEDFQAKKEKFRTINYLTHNGFRKFINKFENTMASEFKYKKGKKISYNQYIDIMTSDFLKCVKLGLPYKKALRIY